MAYGVTGDVVALVPILNSMDYPTAANRTTWLDQISAIIDSKLAAKDYTVPVLPASTTDYLSLTNICTTKVAAMCIRAAALGDEWDKRAAKWEADYDQFLKDISKGDFVLVDQSTDIANKTGVLQFALPQRRPNRYRG